jgi:hypothetical protein
MTDNEMRIPEIADDEWDVINDAKIDERIREHAEWLKTREPDPTAAWDMNPENAYKCSECPHNNEGSWNSTRPCGCMACWVTQTCHTWDGRDDI